MKGCSHHAHSFSSVWTPLITVCASTLTFLRRHLDVGAVDAALGDPDGLTGAFVVAEKGQIIAER